MKLIKEKFKYNYQDVYRKKPRLLWNKDSKYEIDCHFIEEQEAMKEYEKDWRQYEKEQEEWYHIGQRTTQLEFDFFFGDEYE